jgi:general stress protein 26
MSREIPDDHPSLDLKKALKFVLSTLEKGVTERGHDFHLLVLGTLDEENNPQTRNVVLRKVDLSQSLLRFHTDKRSNKILDIKNNNSISLLGYDKSNKLQVRIMARAEIESSQESLLDLWSDM